MEDGRQGFVVPLRDEAAIVDRLAQLAEDRSLLAGMEPAGVGARTRVHGPAVCESFVANLAFRDGKRIV